MAIEKATADICLLCDDDEIFMENYSEWYNRIKRAKFYNSYYRNERMFNKSEYFEL